MVYKKFLVYGMAKSGLATARYLLSKGHEVYIGDDKDLSIREDLPKGCQISKEGDYPKDIEALILAPGIPLTHPEPHKIVKWAKENNIEIISDIELFYRDYQENQNIKYIAVTGTNGKSTVTALTAHLLKEMGKKAYPCGNIGTAMFDVPLPETHAANESIYYVIEISSYQADLCHKFTPDSVCLINLTPDHIDRHGSIEGYFQAKMRLFEKIPYHGKAVITTKDEWGMRAIEIAKNIYEATTDEKLNVRDSIKNNNFLKGEHNYYNALTAFELIRAINLPAEKIYPHFANFIGLPHRCEFVATKKNITFINDSKATNAESSEKAITAFENIYWLVGGIAKSEGIEPLLDCLEQVNHVFIYGQDQKVFADSLRKTKKEFSVYHTMNEAFSASLLMALQDEEPATILLSPSAASFDGFKNFEHRGEVFKQLVAEVEA